MLTKKIVGDALQKRFCALEKVRGNIDAMALIKV